MLNLFKRSTISSNVTDPTQLPVWKNLTQLYERAKKQTLTERFTSDPKRFDRYHLRVPGLLFDYSKHPVDETIMAALIDLARAQNLEEWRERMFTGETINTSQNIAALHTALRRPKTDSVMVDGTNIMPDIHHTLDRLRDFSTRVRKGQWRGYTGEPITDIVNIGIGGSDLGPTMACAALAPYGQSNIRTHFVSNVDGADLSATLKHLHPAHTLFLIASKAFTTQETMVNAHTARTWLLNATNNDYSSIAKHFVALSANQSAVTAFGIEQDNMFPFWDYVGGRYSVWSSIGLSLMLQIGFDHFRAFLDGAAAMDQHFRTQPLAANLPVIMALLGIWHSNFYGAATHAVLPYDQHLARLPAYLQQLEMESNGKRVTRDGTPVTTSTAPIIFGEPGTNAQHSFFQLVHQGTQIIPCDFIAAIHPHHNLPDHHQKLLANALAQPQALMHGKTNQADPARHFPGNRPSSFFLLDRLDPFTLGQLLAAYEHKVFTQGIIWGLNSFDQPGVELGKVLANDLLDHWDDQNPPANLDSSTAALLNAIKAGQTAPK